MDSSLNKAPPIRRGVRKFSKIPEKTLLKKRPKSKYLSINQSTLKAYSIDKTFLIRSDTSKKRKRINLAIQTTEKTPVSAKLPTNFPSIESLNPPLSKVRMSLKGKEDKLDALISNFIEHKPAPATSRFQDKFEVGLLDDSEEGREKKFYEKNIEDFRGQEMFDYQHDLEKNLKIEKIRLKSYKKTRERLQSM